MATHLKFNWDDIEVGDNSLNHSHNFFAIKHISHERLEPVKVNLIRDIEDTTNKENILSEEVQSNINTNTNINSNTNALQNANTNDYKSKKVDNLACDTTSLDVTILDKKVPSNIACEWSSQKQILAKNQCSALQVKPMGGVKKVLSTPHAYRCKDIYQKRKEEAERKQIQQEIDMRKFNSRPMPKFSNKHAKRDVVHACTVPITPVVLKHSILAEEKHKLKMAEWKRQNQPLKFQHRSPTILKEEPFKPKKIGTIPIMQPFNLKSESRGRERKLFDEFAKQSREQRIKEEAEEQKKREEVYIREIRKLTIFKATPNPFKGERK